MTDASTPPQPYPRMFVAIDKSGKAFQGGQLVVSWASEESLPGKGFREVVFQDEAQSQINHWKANHAAAVFRSRVLLERPDLPLERVRAYGSFCKMQSRLFTLETMLESLARDSAPLSSSPQAPSVPLFAS